MEWLPLTIKQQDYYHVREDCRAEAINLDGSEPSASICEKLWHSSPFVGEFVLSDKQRASIISSGAAVIKAIIRGNTIIEEEQNILVIAMILCVQEFDDNDDETQMWKYLGKRLSFDDDSVFLSTCSALRRIIRKTLLRNNRYLAEDGHIYYNTLLIHALAPSWTIFHLFNIIYSFYQKNLDSRYIERDSSYAIFVTNIAARWESETKPDAELKLKSDSISSSFRQLFSYRKKLMTAASDTLVCKIDEMLKNGADTLDMNSRWDVLLKQWFMSKTEQEQAAMQEARLRAGKGRIATKRAFINPSFKLDDEQVFLCLPRIRLPEITRNTYAELYQNEKLVQKAKLPVRGDELCWTTEEFRFLITDSSIDDGMPLRFHLKIICRNNETVYDSGTNLFREYILFKKDGSELKNLTKDSQYITLFTDSQSQVEIDDDPDSYYSFGEYGYLFRLCAGTAKHLFVNGNDIFSTEKRKAKIRCFFSEKHLQSIFVRHNEERYLIFDKAVNLKILSDSETVKQDYYILVNGEKRLLKNYGFRDGALIVPLPWKSQNAYSVKVVESNSNKTIFASNYYVFFNLRYEFDKPYYTSINTAGSVIFSSGSIRFTEHFVIKDDSGWTQIHLWDEYLCDLKAPVLSVSLNDQDALNLPPSIWNGSIDTSAYLRLTAPPGVKTDVILGADAVPSNEAGTLYELGNFLHRGASYSVDSLPLGIITRCGSLTNQILLTDIEIRQRFTDSPLTAVDGKLLWNPGAKYIGPGTAKFFLRIWNNSFDKEYKTDLTEGFIDSGSPLSNGLYNYSITTQGGLFSKKHELYKGQLAIGNPAEFKHNNKKLSLLSVRYLDLFSAKEMTKALSEHSVYITGLKYTGRSIPDNTSLTMTDEYSGILYRCDSSGEKAPYSFEPSGTELDAINPVKVWIVDRKRLVLKCANGEDVFLNTKTSSTTGSVSIINSLEEFPLDGGFYVSTPIYFNYKSEEEST